MDLQAEAQDYILSADEQLEQADDSEQTQQTQSTQQASQPANSDVDAHLFGYLQPCSASLTRIDFWRACPRYKIGRNTELNQVVLPGMKISNIHCTITWDGQDDGNVVVCDLSSNGTYINNIKIGKNQTRVLKEGNEIAFGTCVPQPQNSGLEDYRFIYRHTAKGKPTSGLYAFYDITQELGKGSFAVVMKAVSRATGKWYAVKMIQESRNVRSPNENGNNHGRKALFAREISILESLQHRNICQLKEVFYEESGDINLVLELVEGGDLLDYILKQGGLVEADAQHITYQLCDALAHIHSRNVTHRDLKPENVLLTRDVPPIVKVADFGLAKVVDSLTMLRTMCGTPSYLAPEVVKQENNEGYDSVVDSWSVGVIVFSMLTNASPFIEDDNQRDIRTRVAERTVDWKCLQIIGPSPQAYSFVQCLLEENPKRRMTMLNALHHPWFANYIPFYGQSSFAGEEDAPMEEEHFQGSSSNGAEVSDGSFRSSMSEGFQNLNIQGSVLDIPGAFEGAPGRREPLQRRSHLLSQAAEEGKIMPEPSWEMVANAARGEARASGSGSGSNSSTTPTAGTGTGKGKGPHKRVYSELTPLPEESGVVVVDVDAPSSPLSEVDSLYRKSPVEEDVSREAAGKTEGKTTRGKGRGGATPARKTARTTRASKEALEDGPTVQPRRSGRHPQKVPRHT